MPEIMKCHLEHPVSLYVKPRHLPVSVKHSVLMIDIMAMWCSDELLMLVIWCPFTKCVLSVHVAVNVTVCVMDMGMWPCGHC